MNEQIEKATVTKKKFTEKVKNGAKAIKDGAIKVGSWAADHKTVVGGALLGGLAIYCKGFFKGHEAGRIAEHEQLEHRKDTAFQLAMKQAGVDEDELDTLDTALDLVETFGGFDEVRCLFQDQFDEWCDLRDRKEDES